MSRVACCRHPESQPFTQPMPCTPVPGRHGAADLRACMQWWSHTAVACGPSKSKTALPSMRSMVTASLMGEPSSIVSSAEMVPTCMLAMLQLNQNWPGTKSYLKPMLSALQHQ